MRRLYMLIVIGLAVITASCGSSTPEVRYYRLDSEAMKQPGGRGEAMLSIDQFVGDAAYEDPRIVYRTSPYRLDYYYYHRWTSPPGVLVTDYMRVAYERTGEFRSVVSGFNPESAVVLTGRVVAFEEVDETEDEWYGRIVLDMHLRSMETGKIVWSDTIEATAPIEENNPEGLAAALTGAMSKIVKRTAPDFARIASRLEAERETSPTGFPGETDEEEEGL